MRCPSTFDLASLASRRDATLPHAIAATRSQSRSFDNLSALISILAGLLSIPHILPVPDDVKDSYVSEYEHMIYRKMLVAAHAGQKAGLVEPPVEEATHQQELEASVADFEESVSKDSRVSVKKDDGEA